jgi:NADH-quinone oxidoreductase subunit G
MADPQTKEDAGKTPPRGQKPNTVKFKLNGREMEAPLGMNLIEAARSQGVSVPYFCYHPGLTPAGNCRTCLVEASNSKKPITACTTPVAEGLEIFTETEAVKKARAGVLEFILLNHPLDCPICDKSGECMLQDHTFSHGKDRSRMVEEKELKHTKDLGSGIILWGNRCILCTRCVRFCDEVSGTNELCVVERGDRSIIDVFPGRPLDNAMAGNVVDICPVGALISKEFLYEARVWFQKRAPGICTGCARGCNIEVQTLHNVIKRLVPRANPAVNGYWMCDHGRHDFQYVLGASRSLSVRIDAAAATLGRGRHLAARLRETVAAHGPASVAGIGSAFMTNEELYLLRKIFESLGAPLGRLAALARADGREEVFKGGFRISADKNPNRRGARLLLGDHAFDAAVDEILVGIESGEIRALVIVSDRPHAPLGAGERERRLLELLPRLEFLFVFELETGTQFPSKASVVPATTFSEKEGTYVNEDGRVQRARQSTELPRGAQREVEVFQECLTALGTWDRLVSPGAIFEELAPSLGIPGATYSTLGSQGTPSVMGGHL